MPDVSGASAVNTRVHTPTTKRTRGCGCIGHPAFPAPSLLSRAERSDQTSRKPAARSRSCGCDPNRYHPRRRVNQYSRDTSDRIEKSRRTGCPAGACHRARRRRDPVAGHDDEASRARQLKTLRAWLLEILQHDPIQTNRPRSNRARRPCRRPATPVGPCGPPIPCCGSRSASRPASP